MHDKQHKGIYSTTTKIFLLSCSYKDYVISSKDTHNMEVCR